MTATSNHGLVELEKQALSLQNQGKLKEAVQLWSAIIRQEPSWEHGYAAYGLASCREDLGQHAAAKEAYELALAHNSADRVFLGGYASFLYLHGTLKEAFEAHLRLHKVEAAEGNHEAVATTVSLLVELGQRMGLDENAVSGRIQGEGR